MEVTIPVMIFLLFPSAVRAERGGERGERRRGESGRGERGRGRGEGEGEGRGGEGREGGKGRRVTVES